MLPQSSTTSFVFAILNSVLGFDIKNQFYITIVATIFQPISLNYTSKS